MRTNTIVVLITSVFLLSSCIERGKTDSFSFYYRDRIKLTDFMPQYEGFKLSTNNPQLTISGDSLYLEEPELLNPNLLSFELYLSKDNITDTIQSQIRCWREDGPFLKETTSAKWLKKSILGIKFRNAKKKFFKTGDNSILLTLNDTTYSIKDGVLLWRTINDVGVLNKRLTLERNEYNQMLKNGRFSAIRTGDKIYGSVDGLHNWSTIHDGSHSLCKSMIWDSVDTSLVFINYTGGESRVRHYIRKYHFNSGLTDTLLTFYTKKDYISFGRRPYARHIHIIDVDPYTGDWYIGVGDYDDEPGIYRTTDRGMSFEKVGGGNQTWRTLSFIFREKYIYWTADSESPQFISRISRDQLDSLPISNEKVSRFPLFNSALWFAYDDGDIVILSSNSEGSIYDDYHRVYGIVIDENGIPTTYSLYSEKSDHRKNRKIFNQLFILGKDINGKYCFFDNQNDIHRQFVISTKSPTWNVKR